MSMLLADSTSSSNSWINWVLIAVVALLLIAMPVMMNARNKRETQKVQEQTNSLKVGDKVLTTSGVYGTIVEVKFDDTQKVVVLETGGKTKSYLSIDAYAIYTVFNNETSAQSVPETPVVEEKKTVEEKPKKTSKKKTDKAVEAKEEKSENK